MREEPPVFDLIIFDWGNTVMQDFPEFSGPMVTWPHVKAMPGIHRALRELAPVYRLVLATNAYDSDADQVRAALKRSKLDGYFKLIVTSRELGVTKPDPWFFDNVLIAMNTMPYRAVMVGDNFRTDIVGAKYAGLWAVWYNPAGAESPPDVPFSADAQVRSLEELPVAIWDLDRLAESSI